MNKPTSPHRSYLVISSIFLSLALGLQTLIWGYWQFILEPRLYQEAEAQAHFLGQTLVQAQTLPLEQICCTGLERTQQQQLIAHLFDELLLARAPGSGKEFLAGIQLTLSPDIEADFQVMRGTQQCANCFVVNDIALISPDTFNLIGDATLWVDDSFYQHLSRDLRAKFVGMSVLGSLMLVMVWLLVMVLFQRLHQAKAKIEAAGQAKTRFLANVSHELRTPLNAILGYTQLFQQDTQLMAEHGQAIATVHRSGEHLLNLINDVLDFAKAETVHLELHEEEFNLPELLQSLAEMARIRAQLKDIQFAYNVCVDLPKHVQGDHKRLRQVLLNLLSNAVKFTDDGQVAFNVETLVKQAHTQTLRFSIEDTGCGIPKALQEKIFLPFQQAPNSKNSAEGAGLGLTISRQLLALMGSHLKLHSEENIGSQFYFDLTLTVTHVVAPMQTRSIHGYQGAARQLLIVDDNPFNRLVLKQLLKHFQFLIDECNSGIACLKWLETHPLPDLVLMDLLMPDMDGCCTTREIRANPAWQGLPVIAVSAAAGGEIPERALQSGCNAFLSKPVNVEALLDCLQYHLQLEWIYQEPVVTEPESPSPPESTAMVMPPETTLQHLRAAASQHNILELRNVLTQLQEVNTYPAFTEKLALLIKGYQFKQIQQWLVD